ncbi:restriction endonuclease subunit S [Ornithinimicrobium ciconiae]|uniref:Restriction endonuclease subunit S n=1 Tax=Ornithinimicrobium ciconiae TaxID=2594265 RepID=A0A516G6G0_9MICO|nr:restriction endonuclease subunit S [Ornithinimicrobium ciconiae]QDO87085.1 restriction endonuclease subunit S [Ornithinimicrobium ciconiae]
MTTTSPWLADVPAQWKVVPLRHLADVETGSADTQDATPDGEYPFVVRSPLVQAINYFTHDGEAILTPGDGDVGRVFHHLDGKFTAHQRVYVLSNFRAITGRFAYYAFSATFHYATESGTAKSTVDSLRRPMLTSFPLPVPPMETQRVIASFLDRETAKIDALIAKQDALVAALRDRRESAVMAAVTGKGSTGPRRDSGIRWIAEIPEHWQVGNIRRYATMHSGHTPSRQVPEFWEDCTIPWFTLADVWQLRDDTQIHLGETSESISELGLRHSSAELLPAGTVALSRTASVGFSGIMPVPMATSQDFWNWVCGPELLPEFLLRVFRAMRREMRSLMAGSTHQTIYKTDAASFIIPVPPLDEQRDIVEHLQQDLGRMDALVDRAIALVAMLRERRAALITAAVTGRLDVTTYGKAG